MNTALRMSTPSFVLQVAIEHGETRDTRVFTVDGELSIGRDPSAGLCLDDDLISRRHVVVRLGADGLEIEDVSTNGTLVDGVPIRHARKSVGRECSVCLGGTRLTLRRQNAGTEAPVVPLVVVHSDGQRNGQADPLAPLRALLADASVTEIVINGPQRVFIARGGKLERSDVRFADRDAVLAAVAQLTGQAVDPRKPILEARLPDGSLLEAMSGAVAQDGPVVAIRRFAKSTMTLERLVSLGMLPPDAAELLREITNAQCNVLVAGRAGTGKTSLLNVLAACVPYGERVLVLEETRELDVSRGHVIQLEARKAGEGNEAGVTLRDLFRAALRMRADRIIVGELRGGEALELVQALGGGHGALCTLRVTHPRDALARLEALCLTSDQQVSLPAIRAQIGAGIDVMVQLARMRDGSCRVTHITEVLGFDVERGSYRLADLYARVDGELLPTGVMPSFAERLDALPPKLLAAVERAGRAAG